MQIAHRPTDSGRVMHLRHRSLDAMTILSPFPIYVHRMKTLVHALSLDPTSCTTSS